MVFAVLIAAAAGVACTGAEADPPETGGAPAAPATADATPSSRETPTATATPPATSAVTPGSTSTAAQAVVVRPYRLVEPQGVERGTPAPLILVLHGYGQGADYDPLGLKLLADGEGVVLAYAEGTVDGVGRRFWNASEACCNFFAQPVDDVAYLSAVIDDVMRRRAIDPRRVYVAGFSNGAFMAQRLACELPERIAGIVAVSGVNAAAPGECEPSRTVAVLHVHGDADPVVHYLGGRLGSGTVAYPSVMASMEGWRERNECHGEPEVRETTLDLATALPGRETTVTRYTGCTEGGATELWTVHGGSHDIDFSPAFAREVWAFLREQQRR